MIAKVKTHIAYRCPDCLSTIYGYVGKFALSANLLRLKCSCPDTSLDISITNDGKIRLSVPCLFCKQNHSYTVSQNIFFGRDSFLLNCPYSNMDICFIGDKEKIDAELTRSQREIERLLSDLEVGAVSDIKPTDVDEDEILPDATLYDTVKFLVSELMLDGKIDCPCHSGKYDLRFSREGIDVYCEECGAYHNFDLTSPSRAEEIVTVDRLQLKSK